VLQGKPAGLAMPCLPCPCGLATARLRARPPGCVPSSGRRALRSEHTMPWLRVLRLDWPALSPAPGNTKESSASLSKTGASA